MSSLILLTLLPTAPRDPTAFNNDLSDIVIDCFDLTVADIITGIPLGSASVVNVAPYNETLTIIKGKDGHPDKLATSLLQYYTPQETVTPNPLDPLVPIITITGTPFSVAYAVIVVDIDPKTPDYEYDSYDLRIVVSREGKPIGAATLEYNVPLKAVTSLDTNPQTYFDYVMKDSAFPSAYVFIPPKPTLSSTNPLVPISADGQTPVFDDLVTAVNVVLAADHSTTDTGAATSLQERALPLTPSQAHQVAWELTYDRALLPLPVPKQDLASMYSDPNVTADKDQNRKQFEADLNGYHATHDADALKLAGYVYAASAAIECEKSSLKATAANFTFDKELALNPPNTAAATLSVILQGEVTTDDPHGYLNPTFGVPAAFFFAIGAGLPTQLTPADRYQASITNSEVGILKILQNAQNSGVLGGTETSLTLDTNKITLTADQAARRLYALGALTFSLPIINLTTAISTIVTDWLGYSGATTDIDQFWATESTAQSDQYLELILEIIAAEKTDLKAAIKLIFSVKKAADLVPITNQNWRDFFMPATTPPADKYPDRASLLPEYTEPGSTKQRTDAFITNLQKILSVTPDTSSSVNPNANDVEVLGLPSNDAISMFITASTGFSFANDLDEGSIASTLAGLFPENAKLRSWTNKAIHILHFLYHITSISSDLTTDLQFSYMEALYARGFVTADRVAFLSKSQFHSALAGTIAYPSLVSDAIYALATPLATSAPDVGPEPANGFSPINPGDLVNCIPAPHLSPLGPVEYLHQLLQLSIGDNTLGEIVAQRRGPIANLKASMANLDAGVPLIDLVNESLEALGSDSSTSHGAVYDTNLSANVGFESQRIKESDAKEFLDAIPEHSTPAIPVGSPTVYEILKKDFSAPNLPYAQDLDINRTYLSRLGTSRFDIMRTFRKDIAEFALDAPNEPADFQKNVWRFPVRLDIAIEYLGITPEELTALFTSNLGEPALAEIFGFSASEKDWVKQLTSLPLFLRRTGLKYCEFLDLWKCAFVKFEATTNKGAFPACAPYCMKSVHIDFGENDAATDALGKLAVFIRLWRKLEDRFGKDQFSFYLLADICRVLNLFNGNELNPDFLRQFIALLMLCDTFNLPFHETGSHSLNAGNTPAERVKILALWVNPAPSDEIADWAVGTLLEKVEKYAKHKYHCPPRKADFKKILLTNFSALSELAGFTDQHRWNSTPTCTLRFAEILAKIYASHFTVGEIIFLFTNEEHLLGDDPFPYTPESESIENPLNVPEDDKHTGLWNLRKQLLDVTVDDEAARAWSWRKIEATLRRDFGILPPTDPQIRDPIQALGEHFFPCILEGLGYRIPLENKQFRTSLPSKDTSLLLWESAPHGPFHYQSSSSELWIELPLRDEEVLNKLAHVRQLRPVEQYAVRELYFAPRAVLAPFALLFENFSEAVDRLVQEADENERFAYFQQNFALFYCRCKIIAEHLAHHVNHVTAWDDSEKRQCGSDVAWRILRSLFADENDPSTSWEDDSGKPPESSAFKWDPYLSGNAFAALLGLTGTGLMGEFEVGGSKQWREIRAPLGAFDPVLNEKNVPVPTIIPSLNITPSAAQQNLVVFRNGFALRDLTAEYLGGASPFCVTWSGVLLVEHSGDYRFHVNIPSSEHEHERHEHAHGGRWLVTLRRGQKHWTLLSHKWKSSDHVPSHESLPVGLSRGGYEITVKYEQHEPTFSSDSHMRPLHTGFILKYCGRDTEDQILELPVDKLFLKSKDHTLDSGIEGKQGSALQYLSKHYVSSLRDIRRTYQRAFKAILFAYRFHVSDRPNEYCHGESELSFLLEHPANFVGTSYYHSSQTALEATASASSPPTLYTTHQAYLDFNFLPVCDAYIPPPSDQDMRVRPSQKRRSALFDWWERTHDYRHLSHEVHERLHDKQSHGPLWLLFYEAAVQEPVDGKTLVRHLGIDMSLAPLVLTYFDNYVVGTDDLEDERWTIRLWKARGLLIKLQEAIYTQSLEKARPDLWSSNLPSQVIDATVSPPLSGNQNLTHFVQQSYLFDNNNRQFKDIENLNNTLREHGRAALIAYLCAMKRVKLPFTDPLAFASTAQDLSDLFLQDIEIRLDQHSSRIEDAIHSVQTLVQRVRLGLESTYHATSEFIKTWDSSYCNFEKWKHSQRRQLYSENWIQWEELQQARKSEAFRFFETNIDRGYFAIPHTVPPGVAGTDDNELSFKTIQSTDFAREDSQVSSMDEGLGLIGTPAQASEPSWLSASTITGEIIDEWSNEKASKLKIPPSVPDPDPSIQIPLWFQAAVRLGTRFVRVAAAGFPIAMYSSLDPIDESHKTVGLQNAKDSAPVMDEYYFWLTDGTCYDSNDITQNADQGVVPPDPTSDWERADKLPALLYWPVKSLVHLTWTRVHLGKFEPPRRSAEGFELTSDVAPVLNFTGRHADSLLFTVIGSTQGGFRYDMKPDAAVVLPLVVTQSYPTQQLPAPFNSYPYFIYSTPGAPLVPVSPFGTALSVAGTLRTHCRFEAALAWCRAAFDPLKRVNTWAQCPPEAEGSPHEINSVGPHSTTALAESGPCCPTSPVKAGIARGRAAVLEYLEILLQWGESLACQNTTESIQQALVLLNEASRILGPQPEGMKAQNKGMGDSMTVQQFKASYAAINPRLISLYERVFDQRKMIQNCLNLRRLGTERRSLSGMVWGTNALDNSQDYGKLGDDLTLFNPNYRFTYLLPKAMELVNTVKNLGGALLSAYEKGDSEYLNALRQTQERQLGDLMLEMKQYAYRQADWQVQSLEKQLESGQTRLRFNQQNLRNGLNSGESGFVLGTNVALATRIGANVVEGIAQGMAFIPDVTVGGAGAFGSPVEINRLPIGTKLAGAFEALARIMQTIADIAGTQAGLSETTGGWQRRSDEWQNQVDTITLDIASIQRQQLAAERQRDMSLRELNNQQELRQQSAEVQDFLRDKFTKQDLYLFLQQTTAGLYRRAYELAYQTARETQHAFQYERKDLTVELPKASWDDLHEGLMAGEQLEMVLHSMDNLYTKVNLREYELTKHFSLRLHLPLAFLQLKTFGWCEFEIPEWMFDLDYPGHYMRRIKNVSLTIPCIVGPYVGVHCRLQLLSSGIRMEPNINHVKDCCCKKGDASKSYDDYHNLSRQFIGSEAIATSGGQSDSGLFELNFRDERFIPFEFSGAVSRWRLELPPQNNQFDLETVSDIIMHMNYTAREGGAMLRCAADESAQRHLPGGGIRFFDVRQEFAEVWSRVFALGASHEKGRRRKHSSDFPLRLSRRMFPYLTGRRTVTITSLHIFIEVNGIHGIGEHITVQFIPGENCKNEKKNFICVASTDMPCFYQGKLDVSLGPLYSDEYNMMGNLRFPESIGGGVVRQVYFLCPYVAHE